ncbi:hypothetical protein L1049_013535 [Liquidambar formosana]|uniref:Uncharacterized protein n=1 Tax=Liquidambar formosana TaxID=63359 RepID=A0AAP0RM09_LIQFO
MVAVVAASSWNCWCENQNLTVRFDSKRQLQESQLSSHFTQLLLIVSRKVQEIIFRSVTAEELRL